MTREKTARKVGMGQSERVGYGVEEMTENESNGRIRVSHVAFPA